VGWLLHCDGRPDEVLAAGLLHTCQLRDRVAHAESDTLAIFAADKIAKVRELALLPTWRLEETTTAPSSPITGRALI
jgi:hypothetical protein